MSTMEKYELVVGDKTESGHHVTISIAGWDCNFDERRKEYFCLYGICKPERAQALVDAINEAAEFRGRQREAAE